jgi:hypothetical protein
LTASSERDLDSVFETLVQLRAGALMITADGLFAPAAANSRNWNIARTE